MEKEYSNEVKGKYTYRFCDWEKKLIIKCLKPELKKIDNKILKIDNHPQNEGQVTYQCKIDELYKEKLYINEIIDELSKAFLK